MCIGSVYSLHVWNRNKILPHTISQPSDLESAVQTTSSSFLCLIPSPGLLFRLAKERRTAELFVEKLRKHFRLKKIKDILML
jgi:hypothetical protein